MSSTPITVANGLSMPDTSTEVISGIRQAAKANVRTPPNNSMQLTALRAAADAKR